MEDDYSVFPPDSDLDFSFTSTTSTSTATDRTFTSSSARSSLARSSLTLSFNESRLSSAAVNLRPHRHSDPQWSAIKAATTLSSDGHLHLRHLKLIRHLGTGNLGRVFLCHLRDNDHASFALKVVDREALSNKKLLQVQTEAEILALLDHPFLPTLYARLDVSHYTCLLIDYCPAGDLHSLLRKQPGNRLSVSAARFFAAEVLLALEYLHALGIVYRDLKPENVLLREDGHVMLSDFDLCFKSDVVPTFHTWTRRGPQGTAGCCFGLRTAAEEEEIVGEFVAEPTAAFSKSCVGTHEYLAPELVTGVGHGSGVDWWAFGVFIYELLQGTTPFKGVNKEVTLRNIASSEGVKLRAASAAEEEEGMAEARDLIERLLVKDPARRLGSSKGATEIKRHPFFDGIKWPLIRTYRPPEVYGLIRKARSHVSHVTGVTHRMRRRGWWNWRKLSNRFIKNGNSRKSHTNTNYYTYSAKNKMG